MAKSCHFARFPTWTTNQHYKIIWNKRRSYVNDLWFPVLRDMISPVCLRWQTMASYEYRVHLWSVLYHYSEKEWSLKLRRCVITFSFTVYSPLANVIVAWSAPSHYVNQCWNIVNCTHRNKLRRNFNRNTNIFIHEMGLKESSAKRRPFCLGLNVLSCVHCWSIWTLSCFPWPSIVI